MENKKGALFREKGERDKGRESAPDADADEDDVAWSLLSLSSASCELSSLLARSLAHTGQERKKEREKEAARAWRRRTTTTTAAHLAAAAS